MSKKILVVDDSNTIRQQVGMCLTGAGYTVVEASDGVEGLDAIKSTPDIAMVICDVNMPNMNGIEMLEAVHADGKFNALPVIMLTTEGQPALISRAKKAGAKGWIVKPFKPDLLLAAAKKLTAKAA
jgi:two-component system, chemotaxis family, chemotaxis protein CheY